MDNSKNHILIVDDEAVAIRILQHTLIKQGYSVQTASNGDEALRLASQSTFELMILIFRIQVTLIVLYQVRRPTRRIEI